VDVKIQEDVIHVAQEADSLAALIVEASRTGDWAIGFELEMLRDSIVDAFAAIKHRCDTLCAAKRPQASE